MTSIKWQDFLNILTSKGCDTGILSKVSSDIDNGLITCYNANRSYLEEWLVGTIKPGEKSSSKSVEFRLSGNKVYKQGKDLEALKMYNFSVIQAPYHTNDFSLALSNRSAALARLGFYVVHGLCKELISKVKERGDISLSDESD